MAISIAGIIINIVLVVFIVVLILIGVQYNNELKLCETTQSTFCYNIQCPCDQISQAPCFGYAKMPGPKSGQWYCSNAPLTLVDNNGNII